LKKKILIGAGVAIIIVLGIGVFIGLFSSPEPPPPITPPPKFEYVEINLNENRLVKGNLIKLISIEEEKGIVKIEVYSETTGEPIVVPLSLRGGVAFNYKNISVIPGKVEDNKVTFLIFDLEPIDVEKKSSENVSRPHIPPEELKRVVFRGRLINIAFNDTRVKEEIGNWSYEIGDIVYMEYEARNGELKIKGTFPVVPIYLPSKNDPGDTLLVFINPDDETVIDVGHDYRRVELPY
jgi:hypothetical protein